MVRFTNVAYIFWSDERQVFCVARFLIPIEPFGLPRPLFFGSSTLDDSSGITLILEYTPLEETVVTPLGIGARRFLGAAAGGGSFFVILRRRGGGGLSSVSSSSGFLNETCLGFRSMALACGVRMDIAVSFFALAKGFGRITRGARGLATGAALLERLRVVSTLASRVPSVGVYRVLCPARDRGARPRGKLKGGVGRGAGVGILGRMAASGRDDGRIGVGRTDGGAAIGGGKVGGFAIPEFQGATLAVLSAFRDLS